MNSERFRQNGYEVVRGFLDPASVEALRREALADLQARELPLEYEAEVGYPGAPASMDAPGGNTVRRLLSAYSRHELWRDLATGQYLGQHLEELIGEAPMLSQTHHNCVMTKHPGYSSATHWHQDIRYWSFERRELVSAWFALTRETAANGAILVIPGSHLLDPGPECFDKHLFFRPDHLANRPVLDRAIQIELDPGDLLLFHCRTMHAAGKNSTDTVKLSAVFTYHGHSNPPIPNTKSSSSPPIPLQPGHSQ